MIFTPASAVFLLLLATLFGATMFGFTLAMLAAIASVGAIILLKRA
jgi:hypothetical protein